MAVEMPECFPSQMNTGQGEESVCLLEVNVLNSALWILFVRLFFFFFFVVVVVRLFQVMLVFTLESQLSETLG